jgi:hypothetical protein
MSMLAVRYIGFDSLYLDRRQWESASHKHQAWYKKILGKRLGETHVDVDLMFLVRYSGSVV